VEDRETKIRRLYMRSIRRGIKEMDLILGAYAKDSLNDLSDDQLSLYDDMLAVNDHDLYAWVNGNTPAEPKYAEMISWVADNYAAQWDIPKV